jgi:glycosyltransferase involved in cell wall biosynthesis
VKWLRDDRPDAVIGFTHYANVLGLTAAARADVPVRIASLHNPAWSLPVRGRVLDRLVGGTAVYSRIVAVSQAVAASFAGHGRRYVGKIVVVPNGLSPLAPSGPRACARAHHGLPPDVPLVVSVGRLVDQKNHATLVRAIAALPGVWLAVAGEGPRREALVSLCRGLGVDGRVRLLGELRQQEVADLLHAADVFAMPSIHEGMSVALIEAMSAGLPIVASDIPSQVEVLRSANGDAGILLPARDHVALASAIDRLLSDPLLRRHYGDLARRRAESFSVDRMVSGFERCLQGNPDPSE